MDITNVVVKKVQKRTKFTANGIVTINPPNGNNNSSGGGNGDVYGENIPAPHLHSSDEPSKHRYFFRYCCLIYMPSFSIQHCRNKV